MPATVKDIAQRLNISVSTVSYALNGGPRSVSKEVRDKVLAVAKEIGYSRTSRHHTGSPLRANTIGIVPSDAHQALQQNTYFHDCFDGMLGEADVHGQDLLVFVRNDYLESDQLLTRIMNAHVDGVVFVATPRNAGIIEKLAERKIPFVSIGTRFAGSPAYCTDNVQGVSLALKHLYELGHRRIAHIAGRQEQDDGRLRLQAFRDACADLGLSVPPEYIEVGEFTTASGHAAAHRLFRLPNRPTAIFCANDDMAIGASRAAWEFHLDVPEDISLVGFDDTRNAPVNFPPLTTIRQPIGAMAATAFLGLLDHINGQRPPDVNLYPTELVRRASTSHPIDDPIL